MEYDESAKFYAYEDEDQDLWLLLHTRAMQSSGRERKSSRDMEYPRNK